MLQGPIGEKCRARESGPWNRLRHSGKFSRDGHRRVKGGSPEKSLISCLDQRRPQACTALMECLQVGLRVDDKVVRMELADVLEVRVHKADTKSNKSGERTSFCTMPVSTHGWETESPMRTGDVDAATALSSSHPPNMFCLWPSLATVLTELLAPHENTRRNTSKQISKITRFFFFFF